MEFSEQDTFGSVFVKRRNELGLSVSRIERDTNIRRRYLEAIEKMDFDALPRRIYLERILKQLCEYLSLPYPYVEKLWKNAVNKNVKQREFPGSKKRISEPKSIFNYHVLTPKKHDTFLFTPRLLVTIGTVIILAVLFVYFFFLYSSVSSKPKLDIIEPLDNITVRSDNIYVEGFTEPGNSTSINGNGIPVNQDGYFKQQVGLNAGINKIFIQTEGTNGKISTVERIINADIGTIETNNDNDFPIVPRDLNVSIKANQITWLRVIVDDKSTYELLLNPGSEKAYTAKDTISLKVGNAGGVAISVNNKEQDPLGESGEVVEITYTLDDFKQ